MASNEDMSNTVNRLVGGLINAILGALILWVGQTTFRHAGILATVDEKLNGIQHRFEDVDQRAENQRKWMETIVSDIKDNYRSQFTTKDGEKLIVQLRQAEQGAVELERKFTERLNGIELRLATLQSQHQGSQAVAQLQTEIAQLRGELQQAAAAQQAQYQSAGPNERVARGMPVFLPPVDSRR